MNYNQKPVEGESDVPAVVIIATHPDLPEELEVGDCIRFDSHGRAARWVRRAVAVYAPEDIKTGKGKGAEVAADPFPEPEEDDDAAEAGDTSESSEAAGGSGTDGVDGNAAG